MSTANGPLWRCGASPCTWAGDFRTDALAHEREAHEGAAVCMAVDPELDAFRAARAAGATSEQAQAVADPYRREATR